MGKKKKKGKWIALDITDGSVQFGGLEFDTEQDATGHAINHILEEHPYLHHEDEEFYQKLGGYDFQQKDKA